MFAHIFRYRLEVSAAGQRNILLDTAVSPVIGTIFPFGILQY